MYEHIKASLERQHKAGWVGLFAELERKSHIVSGKNPANGLYYEQRVQGTATEVIAWANQQGLVGEGFAVSKDIYALS